LVLYTNDALGLDEAAEPPSMWSLYKESTTFEAFESFVYASSMPMPRIRGGASVCTEPNAEQRLRDFPGTK
jgi:hypothetical protein